MKTFTPDNIKILLAVSSFIFAILFGGIALIIPPPGVIDASVLILIAQLLVLTCTLIGLQLKVDLKNLYFDSQLKNKHEEMPTPKEQKQMIADAVAQDALAHDEYDRVMSSTI